MYNIREGYTIPKREKIDWSKKQTLIHVDGSFEVYSTGLQDEISFAGVVSKIKNSEGCPYNLGELFLDWEKFQFIIKNK